MPVSFTIRNPEALARHIEDGFGARPTIRMGLRITGPAATCTGLGVGYYPCMVSSKERARFWSYVDRGVGPNACWLWARSLNGNGYGQFVYEGEHWIASRFAYFMVYGIHPGRRLVMHSCDTRSCVRPKHLSLGSYQDNSDDMMLKGRNPSKRKGWADWVRGANHWSTRYPDRVQKGSKCGRAKLTERQVLQIRALYKRGVKQADLAAKYGVANQLISRIVNHGIWRHI